MAPSLSGLPVRTCVWTFPRWEPMWQYPVKITNMQLDITFVIPKIIGAVPSHAKVIGYCHIGSQQRKVSTEVRAGRPGSEGGMGEMGPNQMKMWSGPRHLRQVANKHVRGQFLFMFGWITSCNVIDLGHVNCLIKVEITWVSQDPRPSPQFSLRLPINTLYTIQQ